MSERFFLTSEQKERFVDVINSSSQFVLVGRYVMDKINISRAGFVPGLLYSDEFVLCSEGEDTVEYSRSVNSLRDLYHSTAKN